MQIIRRQSELKATVSQLHSAGERLALVPTMGALHAGHLALVEAARAAADRVIASIFVNPLQFGAGEDLDRYPRREAEDSAMLEKAGCDLLWLPSAEQLYPPGFATSVRVAGLGERWEGEARPGHFDGVATVVVKLLAAVRPDAALFGEKDFQQLSIVRRIAADLDLGVEVIAVPTVRDADGLALSSRNAYLGPDERRRAAALPRALKAARAAILAGRPVAEALAEARRALAAAGFAPIDYFALVDETSLEPVGRPGGAMRLIAAASIGGTRLIDNLQV